jgi:hypothetical protein
LFGDIIQSGQGLFFDTVTRKYVSGSVYVAYMKAEAARIQNEKAVKIAYEQAKIDAQRKIYDDNILAAKKKAEADLLYEQHLSSQSKEDVKKSSGFSKLILPIGAGLAALFFLKGH